VVGVTAGLAALVLATVIVAAVCYAIVRKRKKAGRHSVLREELSTFSSGSGTWKHDMALEVRQIQIEGVVAGSADASVFLEDNVEELL
jgi:hypothetical protein